MGTNCTESERLVVVGNLSGEVLALVDSIVSVVRVNGHTKVSGVALKLKFGTSSFVVRNLVTE